MMEGMLNALSGLRAASRKLQNSANNVANVQTRGFKSSQIDLKATKGGGLRATATNISGASELSNVDLTSEAVDQIANKAAFKANAQVIKTMDEITDSILDIKA